MSRNPLPINNAPVWNPSSTEEARGFQEIWFLKFNDPIHKKSLLLRFTLLVSGNGFRQVAETWAVFLNRPESSSGGASEIQKIALRQSHDIQAFSSMEAGGVPAGIRVANCELSDGRTRGVINSKGHSIRWDFVLTPTGGTSASGFSFVPDLLGRAGIVRNRMATVQENLLVSGSCEIDGQKHVWTNSPGMQAHGSGPRNPYSWVWGHCNSFVDDHDKPVPFVFDGCSMRPQLLAGTFIGPTLSTFYFVYNGQEYRFNSVWDAIRSRSSHTFTEWRFQAEHKDITFRGCATAEHRDFAGLTFEDTDGSLLFCANSTLADLVILVYRRGKLEATLNARGTATFEVGSRGKNPYVPILC